MMSFFMRRLTVVGGQVFLGDLVQGQFFLDRVIDLPSRSAQIYLILVRLSLERAHIEVRNRIWRMPKVSLILVEDYLVYVVGPIGLLLN